LIEENEQEWEGYKLEDAEFVFIAYGVSSRSSQTAVDLLREKGIKAGLFRPKKLFPFPKDGLKELAARVDNLFVVEMSMGMLIDDVKLTIYDGREIGFLPAYGGHNHRIDDLVEAAENFLKTR